MLVLFDITAIAFLLALLLTPLVRNRAIALGLVDKPDNVRKTHESPIPRVGGIGVIAAYIIAIAFIAFAPYRNLTIDLPRGIAASLALAPAAGVVFLTGLADDLWGLRPWQKLAGQVVAALLAYWAGFGVQVFRGQPLGEWISVLVTVVWLIGCSNALNLIDGMDGLAAGVGIFATMTSLVAALVHGSVELAIVTAPLVGALLGFLRYNFNPASIFLGDCGSLLIGFLLGCFGALWSHKSATVLGMTAPLIAMAMPLLDTGLAVVRRFLRRQPIMSADRAHIHHRLLDQGLTPRRAALLLYAGCGVAAVLALLQDMTNERFGGLIIILFCAGAWMGIQHLGYAEFGVTSRMIFRGAFRDMVKAQMRLQQFERELEKIVSFDDAWQAISETGQELGWMGARMRWGGRLYDSLTMPEATAAELWQVRVPLPDGQFLNLYYDPQRSIHPVLFSTFPVLLERYFKYQPLSNSPALVRPQDTQAIETA
jgi:UDP-GlcNAc:undecaprenyl-phosphate GlcNAc-1-phosphate transferase